jgi:glycosyltransferase involved in cell wall biosynthesis
MELQDDRVLSSRLRDSSVPIYDVPEMRRDIHPLADLLAFQDLRRLIRQLRPEIVHTHMSKAGILGRMAAAAEHVPHVLHSIRGWSFQGQSSRVRRYLYRKLEQMAARHTEVMLAVGYEMIEQGFQAAIYHPNYTVVRSGIDLDGFPSRGGDIGALRQALAIPSTAPVVGTVSQMCESKAPLDFVAAAERVAHQVPSAHFLMVGDGPLRQAVEQRIRRASLDSRFHLLGTRSDVSALLALMDVFLFTSQWEGLPRAIVEAMAARVPIVATSVAGTTELLVHGISGLLAPAGDIDGLATHIQTLLSDRDLARRLAEEAHNKISAEFDLAVVVNRHEQIYRQLLRGSSSRGRGAAVCT